MEAFVGRDFFPRGSARRPLVLQPLQTSGRPAVLTSGRPEERGDGGGVSYSSVDLVDFLETETLPSTPSPTKPIPISELLAPSFLSLFHEPLPSYTIWDYCAAELNASNDGGNPATSIDDLLAAFEPLLAADVMRQIRTTLDALKHSSLGVETTLLPSKDNILENILLDLKERAYGPVDANDAAGGSGWEQVDANDGDDGGRWEQMPQRRQGRNNSRGGGATGGRGGRVGDARGRGSRQHGHGQGDGDDENDPVPREVNAKARFFEDVDRILVNLDAYTTPPKGDQEQCSVRKRSIAERAEAFSRHSEVTTAHVLYSPYDVGGVACFYHGTRLLMSEGFSRVGVQPSKTNTEFSSSPAFYVTNDVATAFEFPLHNHLANDPKDTVAVFCFELNLGILHGDLPAPSGETFKVRWFEPGVNDKAWREFCLYNLYGRRLKRQHGCDIVIGSTCYPDIQSKTVTPRRKENLVQVAFCSEAAWKWVGSCVKRMYIENRVDGAVVDKSLTRES